jgi:hypothetical protein
MVSAIPSCPYKSSKTLGHVLSNSSRSLPNKTTYFRWVLLIETIPRILSWLDCLPSPHTHLRDGNEKSNEEHPMVSASPFVFFLKKKPPKITTTGNMAFSSLLWRM